MFFNSEFIILKIQNKVSFIKFTKTKPAPIALLVLFSTIVPAHANATSSVIASIQKHAGFSTPHVHVVAQVANKTKSLINKLVSANAFPVTKDAHLKNSGIWISANANAKIKLALQTWK